MQSNNVKYFERRKGPDLLVKWVKWTGIVSWIVLFSIMLITDMAKPPIETFFDRMFNVKLRTYWDTGLIRLALVFMVVLFLLSVAGIIANSMRHRRKTDRYNKSVIFSATASFIGILFYIFYFQLF
jgi:hypothetical protein